MNLIKETKTKSNKKIVKAVLIGAGVIMVAVIVIGSVAAAATSSDDRYRCDKIFLPASKTPVYK